MFVKHELVVKDHETMHKCWGGWKMGILWPTSKWLIYCRGFWDPMCFYLFLVFFKKVEGGGEVINVEPPPPASFP